MIILGLLLEVMDLSAADLDNVTRPRLPAGGARRPGKRPIPARSAPWRAARVMAKSPTSRKGTSHHTGSARTPYAASTRHGSSVHEDDSHANSDSCRNRGHKNCQHFWPCEVNGVEKSSEPVNRNRKGLLHYHQGS